ncbi:MAG: UDP-N-acetylmuramate dehydrogenase [Lachnospiraceae bacterium]|nr:UDP-N-acetylmuramate dehydrogenase [Lachnospiraceae bacterium]
MNQAIKDEIIRLAGAENVLANEPMARHTTFRVGGPADLLVCPKNPELLRELVVVLEKNGEPYQLIGRGSNLLVSDEGYRGVILALCDLKREPGTDAHLEADEGSRTADSESESESEHENLTDEGTCLPGLLAVSADGTKITAGAGVSLGRTAGIAYRLGLGGMEFAAGIPGSVGGAIVMNAGAYGGEMKQIVSAVTLLDPSGEIRRLSTEEMHFGYRTSLLKEIKAVVLSAEFTLTPEDPAQIREKMDDFAARRRDKQPLNYPSAGSTFKRPEGHFAGQLIEEAGLRGFRIGDAQVSEKHCGFVINRGAATASQIRELISEVQRRVYEQSGIHLETEVILLGE